MKTTIWFDMDGTIANLYGVPGWLAYLQENDPTPSAKAEPMVNMTALAVKLNALQNMGYRVGVISWLSKSGTPAYDRAVTETKKTWLAQHLPTVEWDEVHIVRYGTPKQMFAHTTQDVLFDDELQNRQDWTGKAYNVDQILKVLCSL